jgi:hypothetical protein
MPKAADLAAGGVARPGGLCDYANNGGTNGSDGALVEAGNWQTSPAAGLNLDSLKPIPPLGTLCTGWRSQTSFASITDGTSNTLLVGEKFVLKTDLDGGVSTDGSVFSSGNGQENSFRRFVGNNGANPAVLRPLVPGVDDPGPNANGTAWADKAFGSWHNGVCLFVFCDGSVHGIPVSTPVTTMQLLGVRNDGQVVPPYE